MSEGKKWYSLRVISGKERKIKERIELEIKRAGWDDVVKCTVMLADMTDWPVFNRIYKGYFDPVRLPARSAFGCNGLALGAAVEMECIARFVRSEG